MTEVGVQTIDILNGLLDWRFPEESLHIMLIIYWADEVTSKFELTYMVELDAEKVVELSVKKVEFFPSEPCI